MGKSENLHLGIITQKSAIVKQVKSKKHKFKKLTKADIASIKPECYPSIEFVF